METCHRAPVGSTVNCGYARVAMKTLSDKVDEFQLIFLTPMKLSEDYFIRKHGAKYPSPFEVHCRSIKMAFSKKWHPQSEKDKYDKLFSVQNWNSLSQTIKTAHKLSDCDECFRTHYTAQKSFPAKPVYTPPHIVQIDMPDDIAEATFIALSMESLDNESMVRYGHAFVDGLINHKKVDKHRTKSEQSQEKRKSMIQCRDAVEHELTKAVPKTIFKENESLKGYNRKRLSEFYDGPSTSKKKKTTHSPNFDTVTWDKRKVIDDLHEAESQGEKINWSCFAGEHGVEGINGGQVVKEFAILSNINTTILDKQESKSRSCSTKKKIPGYQISIPTFPPVKVVKAAWTDMVESGELLLGVTCTPCTITRYVTEQGKVKPQNIKVEGRKIPLSRLTPRDAYLRQICVYRYRSILPDPLKHYTNYKLFMFTASFNIVETPFPTTKHSSAASFS